MPKIKIDDLEYNTEDLSEGGLKQLKSLQFLETQMLHMKKEIEVYKTAQNTYLLRLKSDMEKMGVKPSEEESGEVE
ncbi:DUF6447 family protein [Amylibacter sp.]|jgi:hypothetical protein|nr:DUF6447 family protein [Amylibacter sp.]